MKSHFSVNVIDKGVTVLKGADKGFDGDLLCVVRIESFCAFEQRPCDALIFSTTFYQFFKKRCIQGIKTTDINIDNCRLRRRISFYNQAFYTRGAKLSNLYNIQIQPDNAVSLQLLCNKLSL
jgi:hypothetical protein